MFMPDTQNKGTLDWTSIVTSFSLLLCVICLSLIAFALRPVSKWANYQSICVEQESSKAPISWAVRKCNGRSKVYQVK